MFKLLVVSFLSSSFGNSIHQVVIDFVSPDLADKAYNVITKESIESSSLDLEMKVFKLY